MITLGILETSIRAYCSKKYLRKGRIQYKIVTFWKFKFYKLNNIPFIRKLGKRHVFADQGADTTEKCDNVTKNMSYILPSH